MAVRTAHRYIAAIVVLAPSTLPGCEPTVTVGEWKCSANGAPDAAPARTAPIAVPWSSGFEDRFCDYTAVAGFCYGDPAIYETVTSPVHSGRHAAAFTVVGGDATAFQARCVRQGALPQSAYYGAWYFVPALAQNSAVWNLEHFQGGDLSAQHGLWDISLVNGATGDLEVVVFDFLNHVGRNPTPPAPIPIGSWFHLELYLARAPDATGEVALYLDDRLVVQATNIVTDDTNWGQWYVGNYATGLSPANSTLYVDDVTISATR
jgi:hypothetical protein